MDLTDLKGIISLMQRSALTELEIEVQDLKLRLARPNPSISQIVSQQPVSIAPVQEVPKTSASIQKTNEDDPNVFKSPMVGTFYPKPSPDDPPFVDIGTKVKPGDVLCIIEAMKVMNEIQSDMVGTITEIFAEDGKSVEYGQPLFCIT